jgi:hypothetical protein
VVEVDRLEQLLAGREVPVQRGRAHPGPPGYLFQRRVRAVPEEQVLGGGNDQLTVAARVGAQ